MPNRETIHIPDNLTRQEIYNLYKYYVQVVKEMTTSSEMHIPQEYGKRISTTLTFQRGQRWGFAIHVLLLNKEGIDRKG